ncbi:MAG TPA: alpha/beta hydrolase [Acidimicrobiales bacterium]|nr:alpha/beta hydrolase [Acidimicrobiales bacterium]
MPFASHDDVDIYYETFGDPADPALLLVNGLGSQCINFRVEWCQMFAARGFFTIRFDNRDVGLSTTFDHVRPGVAEVARALAEGREPDVAYRLADMADDAVAVLDDLGIERAHVMGLSMGGMIVQQLVIDHPERVHTMTSVMSSTGDRDVGQATPEAFAILTGPPATDRTSAIERHLAGLRVFGSPAHYDADRQSGYAGEAFDRSFNPAGVARQMTAVMASGSRAERLRSVLTPTLVLHGDADRLVDISGGRRTAECIRGARFVVMEGMGHDYPPAYWGRWVELVAEHAGLPPAR